VNREVKEINGHLGYWVDSEGNVWTIWKKHSGNRKSRQAKPRLIHQHVGKDSYLQVKIDRETRKVHRLVLEAFVGPCPEGMCCRHLDGNPLNNRLGNLRWGTGRENWEDKIRHGRDKVGHNHGASNGRAKLTGTDVEEIRRLRLAGLGPAEIGRRFGVNRNHVTHICQGKKWRK
jgi:hypothetical protein